jgi:hypothetical protein
VGWIQLAQNRHQCWDAVNMVMNLLFTQNDHNIKLNVREVLCDCVDWIQLNQDRVL